MASKVPMILLSLVALVAAACAAPAGPAKTGLSGTKPEASLGLSPASPLIRAVAADGERKLSAVASKLTQAGQKGVTAAIAEKPSGITLTKDGGRKLLAVASIITQAPKKGVTAPAAKEITSASVSAKDGDRKLLAVAGVSGVTTGPRMAGDR